MYSREDKLRAAELSIRNDFQPAVGDRRARIPMQGLALQLVRGVSRKRQRHSRHQSLPALRRGPEARRRGPPLRARQVPGQNLQGARLPEQGALWRHGSTSWSPAGGRRTGLTAASMTATGGAQSSAWLQERNPLGPSPMASESSAPPPAIGSGSS